MMARFSRYYPVVFFSAILVYFVARMSHNHGLILVFLVASCIAQACLHIKVLNNKLRKLNKLFLFFFIVLVLLYSYLFFRTTSWDGANLYFRNFYQVYLHGISLPLDRFPYPYLTELTLGLIYRLFPINVVFLFFGISAIMGIYTANILYKELGVSDFVRKSALVILAFCPTYIMLTLHEFKVELFLLVVSNLCFSLFYRLLRNFDTRRFLLLAFLSALGVLIKPTFVVFGPLFFILTVLYKSKYFKFKKTFKLSALYFLFFIFPLVSWVRVFPSSLPLIGAIKLPLISYEKTSLYLPLDKNLEVVKMCQKEAKKADLSEFVWYDNSLQSFFTQPFQYLFLTKVSSSMMTFHVANPGPFIFLGIYLLIVLMLLFRKVKSTPYVYFFTPALLFVLMFFTFAKTFYWYLFPVYSVLALVTPLLAEKIFSTRQRKYFILVVCTFAISNLILSTSVIARSGVGVVNSIENSAPSIYRYNTFVEKLPDNYLVMNAAEHQFIVFLPFVKNYDQKVVNSNYFFVASGKTLEDMKEELLQKNIKYILARKDYLFDTWYKGCPAKNNLILNDFLNKHTKEIYSQRGVEGYSLWEVYEII